MRISRYKSRLTIYNILVFAVTMFLILLFVLQGTWVYSVIKLKDQMLQTATNLNLYVQEKTTQLGTDDEKATYLINNANDIYNVVVNYSTCSIEIFSYDGQILAYDRAKEPTYMNDEYQFCLNSGSPAMAIRRNNGIRQVWVMIPIKTKSSAIIGFTGCIMPVTEADSLQYFLFIIIGLCILIGLALLIIAVSQFSQSFTKPIQTLTTISDEINNGNYDKVIQYKKNDEIGDLTRVYNEMTQSINKVIIQLKNERRRLGNVLASLDDGLLALDKEGNVITSNRYVRTYFDITDPKSIYDFNYYTFFNDIFEQLRSGKSNVSEEVEVNGRILLISGSPINNPISKIKNETSDETYLIIIRNVTTARNLEKEQRKFISSVSHELRTPLTTIIGYTDMLMRRQVQDQKLLNKSLSTINREGHRLVRLVDDLLNANSIENMTFSFQKEYLDLGKLLKNVVDQMRMRSLQKEIEITLKAEKGLPLIYGDYDRLSQIFINILHNAIKFSSKGGIIDVTLTEEDDYLTVSIRDYGKGIDPAKKDFIFSAFYRVDEDRARNEGEGGAGLGLYIVKQVVDHHDGRITVDSEVDEGTNITVYLPIATEEMAEEEVDE